MASVMGRAMEVVGHDEHGNELYREVSSGLTRAQPRHVALPPRPQWRGGQLAPGVQQADEGLVPLPLSASAGSPPGQFSSTVQNITYSGQLQKPFRGERLLVTPVRTNTSGGTSATGARLLAQLFVGTDLQGAEIFGWDTELVAQPGAFGTRLTIKQAEPGVLIRLLVTLSSALTGGDTIFANYTILGRIVH